MIQTLVHRIHVLKSVSQAPGGLEPQTKPCLCSYLQGPGKWGRDVICCFLQNPSWFGDVTQKMTSFGWKDEGFEFISMIKVSILLF